MRSNLDRWTLFAGTALVIGALIACKKKEETPAPTASAAPPPPTASAEPPKAEKKDDVKRYADKEKEESGTVKVLLANAKVYKEADDSTDHIATMSKGTLVNRKARYGNYILVDWPSGVGELSPGWMLGKHLNDIVEKVDINAVKNQDAGVQIVDAGTTTVATDAAAATPDAAVATPDAAVAVPDAAATSDAGKKRLKLPGKAAAEAASKPKPGG